MASITELSLVVKRTVVEKKKVEPKETRSYLDKESLKLFSDDGRTEEQMSDSKQTIKWRQLTTGHKTEKSNHKKIFRSTVNHNLQRIETTLSLLRGDFIPPKASSDIHVSGKSKKTVSINPLQSCHSYTKKCKKQVEPNGSIVNMENEEGGLPSKKTQNYINRNIAKIQETKNDNDHTFLITLTSGCNGVVQKADGSCCIKKMYFLSKSAKTYSIYNSPDELTKLYDKSGNIVVAFIPKGTSTRASVCSQSFLNEKVQENFRKKENDFPTLTTPSVGVKKTCRLTHTDDYPYAGNLSWTNARKMIATCNSSECTDRAYANKLFEPKLHNHQAACLASTCRMNTNICMSSNCATASVTCQPSRKVARFNLQQNNVVNNQGCETVHWQSHKKRQAFTSENSWQSGHKNKDNVSIASSIVGSLLCWKCFDMSGDDDMLSTLDSESGSDGNDDPDDGGGDMGCDMDDFDPQEDIEDIEYSSGGGDASDKSSLCDDNSLYQDDIINQETNYGMNFDDYDDDEMEIAQKAAAGGHYDDGFFDLVTDEESREYLYETAGFDQQNDDDIIPDIIDLESRLIEDHTEADEHLY